MSRVNALLVPGVIVASLAAHALAWRSLHARQRPEPRPPALVEMTVATPPAPRPPEPPPAEPPATDTPPPKVARARPAAAAPRATAAPATPPPAPATPPPAPPESPADFTGTTLTSDAGDGWASATGNGEAMQGPVGPASARRGPTRQAGVVGGTGTSRDATPVVGLGDLSRAPTAPDLNATLAHHYPAAARREGKPGKAVVRARIEPDGRARVLRVLSESSAGFGDACRRTLQGSRWQPPLDKAGRPVATELSYTCRFEVDS